MYIVVNCHDLYLIEIIYPFEEIKSANDVTDSKEGKKRSISDHFVLIMYTD